MKPAMNAGLHRRGLWAALGWAMVIAIIAGSLSPVPQVDAPEMSDKVVHLLGYGLLAFWFGMLHPGLRRQCVNALTFVALGVLVEFLQGMTSYRSYDVFDMVANTAGVMFGWALAHTPLAGVLGWVDGRLFGGKVG